MADGRQLIETRPGLAFLICLHIVICCLSLFYVAQFKHPDPVNPAAFHIFYDPARLYSAVIVVAAFAVVAMLFAFADFSFGYLAGFYFYTMTLGYLWLNGFSDLGYNHRLAGFSAAASTVAFLVPALLISSPIPRAYALSARAFENLLTSILLLSLATIIAGASYNFRIIALGDIYHFRDQLEIAAPVSYLVGITSNALLPFAFACFVARKELWRAGAVLLLLLLFYPITLSKLAFFAPAWLVFMVALSRFFQARTAVVLSLLAPIFAGVVLNLILKKQALWYFITINFRMIAVPSNAMDIYSDYFSKHDLTYFCQISVLKPIMSCPYQDPLSILMAKAYNLGNLNASLFATEGIASVGLLFAPVAVFVCGLVIALGNRLSAGLPPRFILISGAILPLALLNVPLSTALLTHGMGLLFLLWYITPRAMFAPGSNR